MMMNSRRFGILAEGKNETHWDDNKSIVFNALFNVYFFSLDE